MRNILLWLAIATTCFGQNVSSSLRGVVKDPSGAAVAGIECLLTNQATGTAMTVKTATDGAFTFPSIPAAEYTVSVHATGFKALEVKDIFVSSSEVRTLGTLILEIGEIRDSVSVTAESAAVQLATAEHSGVITGGQLNDIALKGRDFFALLATIPGVVDTTASREATSISSLSGTFINGARDNQKNFSVDGTTAMDVGGNQSVAFIPNMDAIAEVKVLTSNYQAEYGRNAGGAVTVITKSGTRELHGTAYDYYRHESLNAANFFDNRSATPKAPYRYRITGYSVGGPVFIPRKFNTDRTRFFFFWSQEYTGVKKDYGTRFVNMPTAAERQGDFSKSLDVNSTLIPVKDPLTGQVFPGNMIPKDRINTLGQSILNFFPVPNFTDPDPRNLYRWNYRSQYSGNTPRRNDMLRFDANLTPSFTLFYRYGHDKDASLQPWGSSYVTGSINYYLTPVDFKNPGVGHLVRATKTFRPTLVNETIFGFTKMDRTFDFVNPDLLARSKMGNPPQWYPDPNMPRDYIPSVTFGGQPASPVNASIAKSVPHHYGNPVYAFTDNLTAIHGTHSFKAGAYIERASLDMRSEVTNWRGAFDFSRDINNGLDSNHSFANALLGNFTSYTETTKRIEANLLQWNMEWYVQDNWRVNKRLTLDFGLRLYHMRPMYDENGITASLNPALYVRANAPALYVPATDASGRRVAKDPLTGTLAAPPLIGQFVPGSGDFANGSRAAGKNYPEGLYTRSALAYGPRFGLAYDVFGNGRTALRAGFGMFKDTSNADPMQQTIGNPPVTYSPTVYYGSLDTYAKGGGAIGPTSQPALFGQSKLPSTMNFSLGLQHQVAGTVVDVSYVGSLSRHLYFRREINPIPMFSRFDPKNEDPTRSGRPLPDVFLRPLFGFDSVRTFEFNGSSNYNSLQIAANRRYSRGLQYGVAYTFSKALGVAGDDYGQVSPYFAPRQRNYGPLAFDRSHVFVVNYMYSLPSLSKPLGWKPSRWVLDDWQVSGITSFITGSAFTPGMSLVDGADLTGSTESARITVTGDPRLPSSERTFFQNFKAGVFQRTAPRNFGNAGLGILRNPGTNNWDIAISKRVPLRSETRFIQFRTELFNAWNHTQFSGYFSTARFDLAGNQTDPNFGAYSAARTPRIIQLSLRLSF